MPVTPIEGPTVMEGLSHDGETGRQQEKEEEVIEDEESKVEEDRTESRKEDLLWARGR